jgi:hypothetical protein
MKLKPHHVWGIHLTQLIHVDTSCSLWFATESHVSQLIFMRFEMVTTIKCKACFKDYQDSSVAQKNTPR